MPLPGITQPTFQEAQANRFLNNDVADRIAEKKTEVVTKDWLEGHKRIIGFALLGLGMLANRFGWHLPQDQITNFWGWLQANWDSLSEGVGLLVGIYGSFMASVRHKKEVAVVTEVAKAAVAETMAVKTELVDTKVELEVVKATTPTP